MSADSDRDPDSQKSTLGPLSCTTPKHLATTRYFSAESAVRIGGIPGIGQVDGQSGRSSDSDVTSAYNLAT